MDAVSSEQIRYFRLHTHHLDTWYAKADVERIAGACGLQNSPPGAWEVALHNRVADCTQDDMRQMLEEERTLLQAWSFRGAPVVFPAAESGAFLTALVSTRSGSIRAAYNWPLITCGCPLRNCCNCSQRSCRNWTDR